MTLTLEQLGQTIGEYSSSLINYGLFLSGHQDQAESLAFEALLEFVKKSNGETFSERRVFLFKSLRQNHLNNGLRNVAELESELLFLQLCENFSRDEIKAVLNVSSEYWDRPFENYLAKIQVLSGITSLEKTKIFFIVKHTKHKPHFLSDEHRDRLIQYICNNKNELSAKSLAFIASLTCVFLVFFHFYELQQRELSYSEIIAPMYAPPKANKAALDEFFKIVFPETHYKSLSHGRVQLCTFPNPPNR